MKWICLLNFWSGALLGLALGSGCTTAHYRKSADKEVYKIIATKEKKALGVTNDFNIETKYSSRKPAEVKSAEILVERREKAMVRPSASEALHLAVQNSRNYQSRKENLYLTALTLTRDRYDFLPHLFAGSTAWGARDSAGNKSGELNSETGATRTLRTGPKLGISIANHVIAYFTGSPDRSAVTLISANLAQPLLRGAWGEIAAENLTQSE